MKNQHTSDPIDVLGAIYENMFEDAVESFQKATEVSGTVLHKFIDEAKLKAVKLEKVSQQDADKLAEWLKQDVNEAAHFLSEAGVEFTDWLGFETDVLKSVALDKLLSAADKTKIQMLSLNNEIERRLHPHTGEITGAGTLVCDKCGEKLHFHKAGKVPPCPKCHETLFHRGH
ncbi:MAG: hypothetical protein COB26_12100 [Piscirickettsiaceae bacterium]|nr:MAG: hypothetical protein COB89_04410 [Piscirickettsiaceae bacterium]PCI65898.1 MAG: hypothetical protein COB26_12100 [Piscirickettsiaceae bacterium]